MADALKRGLAAEGFDVDHAADGDDGLWRAREFSHDVLVLDVMLPGTNGYEICRTLRSEGHTTPILMLTAKGQKKDRELAESYGVSHFMTKPVSNQDVVDRVNALAG